MPLATTLNVYFDSSIFCISTFMCPEEIPIASQVSKQWKRAFDNPAVWKQQYKIQGYVIHPKIEKQLVGSEGKLSFKILKIIASYDEHRAIDYKQVFAKGVKAFGTNAWNSFYGSQSIPYSPRPYNMRQFNNQPCPYWPEHRRGDTGVWTLIPEHVSRIEMSIAKHANLSKVKILSEITSKEQWHPTGKTHWLYRTRTAIPKSNLKSLNEHEQMVAPHGDRLPTVAEIIHSIFAEHAQNGTYPFSKNQWNLMRTSTATTRNNNHTWTVGCFGSDGLRVISSAFNGENLVCIAAVHEFEVIDLSAAKQTQMQR